MEAKKSLAEQLTARYHSETEASAARNDWDTRFSQMDLNSAELPEINISELPTELSVLSITAFAFKTAFDLKKSNVELRKQFILSGSVQLNGEKPTDPTSPISLTSGDTFKLSKKHAVRFI